MLQHIYTSPYPSFNIPTNQSISQFLLSSNPDDVPRDKEILTDFDNPHSSITYGGIRKSAALGAAGLKDVLGLQEGQTVCIFAGNSVTWALLMHSVLWAGGYFSAINPLATAYELVHYLSISEPTIIATEVKLLDTVQSALRMRKNSNLKSRILLLDDDSRAPIEHILNFPRNIVDENRTPLPPFDLSTRDNRTIEAGLIFSSGTSGKPKGVVLTHHNLIAQLLTIRATSPFMHNAMIREVFFPSFSHVYGLVSAVLLSAYFGAHITAMPAFSFESYLARCAEIRATGLKLVPVTAVRMTKDPSLKSLDLSSVKYAQITGAPLSSDVAADLKKMLPEAAVTNGFGMSEATITLLREMRSSEKAGSVGQPAAGVSLRIVDDRGEDVEPGKEGECLVKGPTVFMKYKNNSDETAKAFRDGWLCTGDVVRVDEDGYVWLTGRKKELIKYKGNQVPPAELEAVLLTHPLVTDAGVCGVFDQKRDTEVPVGYVVLREDVKGEEMESMLEKLRKHVDERVAAYKRLRGGLFAIDALPKNKSGKLMRGELPAKIEERRRAKL